MLLFASKWKQKSLGITTKAFLAPPSIQLSNQFYDDLRLLYDLQPFIKVVPLAATIYKKTTSSISRAG